ncbi:hypothetical protein FOVG_14915 [Fusarium oxysporum f. sp. pisi HDV247]|uniref:Uncharacterized protein n=1 Tax=Fusarium oxysporum f. sp. pisi HDV247 TaxID=1080344 RepID=W9NMS6_FUSOX|nr:hypothetical protein FOVG_14915 [Fusarium oxysporum f. sp. pisi HDV247]
MAGKVYQRAACLWSHTSVGLCVSDAGLFIRVSTDLSEPRIENLG